MFLLTSFKVLQKYIIVRSNFFLKQLKIIIFYLVIPSELSN